MPFRRAAVRLAPRRHWLNLRCRCPAEAWRFRSPADFAFSLIFCPHPPDPLPLRGRGDLGLFYARGFAPCIPGGCTHGSPRKRQEAVPYELCRSCRADVLLLEVCPHPPRTLQDRLQLANDLRDVCPDCKTVLLVDEAEYPELATAVCLAKKDHIVDDFVYASVSPAYLSAMMDTL